MRFGNGSRPADQDSTTTDRRRWQWGSILAIAAGALLVVAVQMLEGGALGPLLQLPAALIVFGGTVVATLISYSPADIRTALAAAWRVFRDAEDDMNRLGAQLVTLSVHAHRGGPPALDLQIEHVRDPFLRNGLTLVADGVGSETLRDTLAVERMAEEAREDLPIRVLESAAGYAPTLGILGAVMGLMRLMEQMPTAAALGPGIALAFVATVYGIGAANLVLLPIASRLRERAVTSGRRRELMTHALLDMQRRLNPRLVAQKAGVFAPMPNVSEIVRHVSAQTPGARGAIA
jgi:chemotaxis protein MotA